MKIPRKGIRSPFWNQSFWCRWRRPFSSMPMRIRFGISLNTDTVCSLDAFSTLAEELDNLQEKYKVSFVISAGNYDTPPLLDFPRTGGQVQAGRIPRLPTASSGSR